MLEAESNEFALGFIAEEAAGLLAGPIGWPNGLILLLSGLSFVVKHVKCSVRRIFALDGAKWSLVGKEKVWR
jgi:hypothetical protein